MTLELCHICDAPTDRAGRADDSIYDLDDKGPYCTDCRDAHPERFECTVCNGDCSAANPLVMNCPRGFSL